MPKALSLPKSMRPSTIEERRKYYGTEFTLGLVRKWFLLRRISHPTFAIDVGSDSGIYDVKHKRFLNKLVYLSKYRTWRQLNEKLVDYAPEDVYYSRNIFDHAGSCRECMDRSFGCFRCIHFLGQELVFDIDPENIPCRKCKKKEKRKSIYSFCMHSFEAAKREASKLPMFLGMRFGFRKMQVVYSGRGFHVHVFDKNTVSYGTKARQGIAKIVMSAGFHIDEWVTAGSIDLVRLPYSLHGLVSRIPIVLKHSQVMRFDPLKDKRVMPNFLKSRK